MVPPPCWRFGTASGCLVEGPPDLTDTTISAPRILRDRADPPVGQLIAQERNDPVPTFTVPIVSDVATDVFVSLWIYRVTADNSIGNTVARPQAGNATDVSVRPFTLAGLPLGCFPIVLTATPLSNVADDNVPIDPDLVESVTWWMNLYDAADGSPDTCTFVSE